MMVMMMVMVMVMVMMMMMMMNVCFPNRQWAFASVQL